MNNTSNSIQPIRSTISSPNLVPHRIYPISNPYTPFPPIFTTTLLLPLRQTLPLQAEGMMIGKGPGAMRAGVEKRRRAPRPLIPHNTPHVPALHALSRPRPPLHRLPSRSPTLPLRQTQSRQMAIPLPLQAVSSRRRRSGRRI